MVDGADDLGATAQLGASPVEAREPSTEPAPADRGARAEGSRIGRYLVLGEAGAGGMGVVLRAYDPKLRREVALKRLRAGGSGPDAGDGAARLLREARAMARLAHPNVLAVYDVEELDRHTYVAMEYVEGATLREWTRLRARTWREVLATFLQAARGLAAAHAVGLVHRDFKPSNVLVGADGRARVMDFGLARTTADAEMNVSSGAAHGASSDGSDEILTAADVVIGTPAYMAPEQVEGANPDARVDQYAWCVALWEALWGVRPFVGNGAVIGAAKRAGPPSVPAHPAVPQWLAQVLERGLQVDPERRFASMDALVQQVERGQAQTRARGRLLALVVITVAVLLVLIGRSLVHERDMAACAREGASVEALWNDDARARIASSFATSGSAAGTDAFARVQPWLDDWARGWHDARRTACVRADVEHTWGEDLGAAARACLDERRGQAEALLDVLAEADSLVVQRSVQAAAALEPTADCLDEAELAREWIQRTSTADSDRVLELRSQLQRVAALESAGKYEPALARARELVARAEAAADEPILADALVRAGTLAERLGDYELSVTDLERAFVLAGGIGRDGTAAEAALRLTLVVGERQARHGDGIRWGRLGEMALRRLGEHDTARHASLLHAIGNVEFARGDYDESMRLHSRALAIDEAMLGPDHLEVAVSLNNMASIEATRGGYPRALELYARALSIQTNALGTAHPVLGGTYANIANVRWAVGDYQESKRLHSLALSIFESELGPEHPSTAAALGNLASVHRVVGELAEAVRLQERALAIRKKALGPEHARTATAMTNLAAIFTNQRRHDEALPLAERAVELSEKAFGVDHVEHAQALQTLASLQLARGLPDRAQPLVERALAIRERALGSEHPYIAVSAGLLGNVLAARGRLDEAVNASERALAIRERALGGEHPEVAESLTDLAEILTRHGRAEQAVPLLERSLRILEAHPRSPDDLARARAALLRARERKD